MATKSKALKRRSVKPPVALVKHDTSLSLADPGQVMEFGKVLKQYITENDLAVTIDGKLYAKVDAWKFAGFNFGLTGIPRRPEPMHHSKQMILILYIKEQREGKSGPYMKEVPGFVGFADVVEAVQNFRLSYPGKITREVYRPYFAYKCECDIIKLSDRTIVSYGEGMCSNMEDGKIMSSENAINSHSQTRSISRAFRNLLGFVMTSAGMQATPAEEMEGIREQKEYFDEPALSADQYNMAMSKVIKGEWTVEFVKKNSTLSIDQENALIIAEKNHKPKVGT